MSDRSTPIRVEGRAEPRWDVAAVQDAVSQGGLIHLRGRFDFGERGSVKITRDVEIRGEAGRKGRTKIHGGFFTFHSPLPNSESRHAPRIVIDGFDFAGALWTPIHLAFSAGTEITNNRVRDVRPYYLESLNVLNQKGLICGVRYAKHELAPAQWSYVPGAFSGPLTITDNFFDLSVADETRTLGTGIFVAWTTGVVGRIARNRVVNCPRTAIEGIDNHRGENGGLFFIEGNRIITPRRGIARPTSDTPNGIVVGWVLDPAGGLDPRRAISYVVSGNRVLARGRTSSALSVLGASGTVVSRNTLDVPARGATAIRLSRAQSCLLADNVTTGRGCRTLSEFGADDNLILRR